MPTPKAITIELSEKQQQILAQIVRQTTNPYCLVRRAQLILAAAQGMTNSQISQRLDLDCAQVRVWRQRWSQAQPELAAVDTSAASLSELERLIVQLLSDQPRPGTPAHFGVEQVVQIVALACETPAASHRPIAAWTARELADEAVQRGIVETVSPRSVGRFLKRGESATASPSVLAQRQPR